MPQNILTRWRAARDASHQLDSLLAQADPSAPLGVRNEWLMADSPAGPAGLWGPGQSQGLQRYVSVAAWSTAQNDLNLPGTNHNARDMCRQHIAVLNILDGLHIPDEK